MTIYYLNKKTCRYQKTRYVPKKTKSRRSPSGQIVRASVPPKALRSPSGPIVSVRPKSRKTTPTRDLRQAFIDARARAAKAQASTLYALAAAEAPGRAPEDIVPDKVVRAKREAEDLFLKAAATDAEAEAAEAAGATGAQTPTKAALKEALDTYIEAVQKASTLVTTPDKFKSIADDETEAFNRLMRVAFEAKEAYVKALTVPKCPTVLTVLVLCASPKSVKSQQTRHLLGKIYAHEACFNLIYVGKRLKAKRTEANRTLLPNERRVQEKSINMDVDQFFDRYYLEQNRFDVIVDEGCSEDDTILAIVQAFDKTGTKFICPKREDAALTASLGEMYYVQNVHKELFKDHLLFTKVRPSA